MVLVAAAICQLVTPQNGLPQKRADWNISKKINHPAKTLEKTLAVSYTLSFFVVPRDPITENETGFMEPKHFAFRL